MSNISQDTRGRKAKGSLGNPLPAHVALADLCERLELDPVASVDALTDLIVGEWANVLGFREKVRGAVGSATTQYRTGQQSLKAAAESIVYSVKSLREWHSKEEA